MSFTPRTRLVNPKLGTYFGIFTSAFICLVLALLIFEQLDVPDSLLRTAMLFCPLLMYGVFGLFNHTSEPLEFFASGRRVPAVYCGLGLAQISLGATGIVGVAGLLYVIGYDGVCIIAGGVAGFVVMSVLLAPFFRKFGTFTVPSYLGRRFDSRFLRIVSAAFLTIPMLLILIAEFRIGAMAAAWLLGQSETAMTAMIVVFLSVTLAMGGVRSLTWSNVVTSIATLLALLVPVTIIAVLLGYLPLPQLSLGPVVRAVGTAETQQGFALVQQSLFDFTLPAPGFQAAVKPFADPFFSIGPGAYIGLTLVVMAGVASAPWLLTRIATAPGVYEARKSLGWATFFFGAIMLTVATSAVLMRHYQIQLFGLPLSTAPDWVSALIGQNFLEVPARSTLLNVSNVKFDRDLILFSVPVAGQLPIVFGYLVAAGVLAAALAAASATAMCLANQLTEDAVNGMSWEPAAVGIRIGTSRLLLVSIAGLSGTLSVGMDYDPVKLLLWALTITGSTAFPVLVASIWWKRINAYGATAGVLSGFVISIIVILLHEFGATNLNGALAAIIAMPAGALAACTVSLLTPKPTKHLLELVRDIRIPGGEILYDREMRLLRLKRRQAV